MKGTCHLHRNRQPLLLCLWGDASKCKEINPCFLTKLLLFSSSLPLSFSKYQYPSFYTAPLLLNLWPSLAPLPAAYCFFKDDPECPCGPTFASHAFISLTRDKNAHGNSAPFLHRLTPLKTKPLFHTSVWITESHTIGEEQMGNLKTVTQGKVCLWYSLTMFSVISECVNSSLFFTKVCFLPTSCATTGSNYFFQSGFSWSDLKPVLHFLSRWLIVNKTP